MLMKQEKVLIEMASKPQIEITELRTKAITNINILKWVQGANIVLNYTKTLSNYTMALERGQHNPSEMSELIPAINTLIWSTSRLNLGAIVEFNMMVGHHFGPQTLAAARSGYLVDEKLKRNFNGLLPTVFEIDDYLKDFFRRFANDIDKDLRNQHLNSILNHNKNFGGKFGAPPSNYDPSTIGNTTVAGDETKIGMSEFADPIPGPQLSNHSNNSNNSNNPGGFSQGGPSQGGFSQGGPGLPSHTTNNNPGLSSTKQDDEFYSALKGLQLSEKPVTPENPSGPVDNSQKSFKKSSSFISGTGLIGTGLDNNPAEEQQPFSKIKSNFDMGLPSFDTTPYSQGNNSQGNNSQGMNSQGNNIQGNNSQQNNEGLISDLNFGAHQINSGVNDPNAVNFGNTDFTNSAFGNTNPGNQVKFDSTPQIIPGASFNPSDSDFKKTHHSEQPKAFTQNPIGDYGMDFPKAPDFHLGGNYDWNYYPKLVDTDLDGKLAILRKVGA